jgi:transcriptional regulator with XRE-family HTH domain
MNSSHMSKTKEENIGHVIKILRTAAGIKQKALAGKAGIKPNYLSMIESGKREPSLNLLRSIAKALNVPVSYIFWEYKGLPNTKDARQNKKLREIKRLLLEIEQLRLSDTSFKNKRSASRG